MVNNMITEAEEVVKKPGCKATHKKEKGTQLTYISRPVNQRKKMENGKTNKGMEFIYYFAGSL